MMVMRSTYYLPSEAELQIVGIFAHAKDLPAVNYASSPNFDKLIPSCEKCGSSEFQVWTSDEALHYNLRKET